MSRFLWFTVYYTLVDLSASVDVNFYPYLLIACFLFLYFLFFLFFFIFFVFSLFRFPTELCPRFSCVTTSVIHLKHHHSVHNGLHLRCNIFFGNLTHCHKIGELGKFNQFYKTEMAPPPPLCRCIARPCSLHSQHLNMSQLKIVHNSAGL